MAAERSKAVLFSSASDEWATPQWLFDQLDQEFRFTLDPCATPESAKCDRYYTQADNGLKRDWGTESVFMNPPYSEVSDWMARAFGASIEGATVVCLVPSRTDTGWWHDYAMKAEIRFIRGRLRFGDAEHGAPFPSAIVIFRPPCHQFLSVDLQQGLPL